MPTPVLCAVCRPEEPLGPASDEASPFGGSKREEIRNPIPYSI